MNPLLAFAFVSMISSFVSPASAQGVYYPGSTAPHMPMVMCNGGWIPQGTPCGGGYGGGMNIPMVGIPNQPGMFRSGANVYRCSATATWVGRLAGAAAGFLIGKNIRFEGSQMGPLGTVVGVIAGQEIACELAHDQMVGTPDMQQGQGGTVQRGASGQVFTPGNLQSPSICYIDGVRPILGYSESDCMALAERLTKAAPSTEQPQQQVAGKNPCAHDDGTKMGVLNLPGHAKNGQTVCARPGDANISKWL